MLYLEVSSCSITHIPGLVQEGTDQRDFYYIMGLGHYKLEVCVM